MKHKIYCLLFFLYICSISLFSQGSLHSQQILNRLENRLVTDNELYIDTEINIARKMFPEEEILILKLYYTPSVNTKKFVGLCIYREYEIATWQKDCSESIKAFKCECSKASKPVFYFNGVAYSTQEEKDLAEKTYTNEMAKKKLEEEREKKETEIYSKLEDIKVSKPTVVVSDPIVKILAADSQEAVERIVHNDFMKMKQQNLPDALVVPTDLVFGSLDENFTHNYNIIGRMTKDLDYKRKLQETRYKIERNKNEKKNHDNNIALLERQKINLMNEKNIDEEKLRNPNITQDEKQEIENRKSVNQEKIGKIDEYINGEVEALKKLEEELMTLESEVENLKNECPDCDNTGIIKDK
ncbi:MAG: hypothetical protein LBQ22_08680 [Bacteroidales bacterium]|jgi:hypothetical protein|nr:hypothetical protein [Bacteroidales bacterium]